VLSRVKRFTLQSAILIPLFVQGVIIFQAYQDAMDIAPMIEYLRNKSTNHSPLIMISDGWQVLLLPDIFVLLPHLSETCGALDIL